MEDLAPFFVLNFENASLHTDITLFWLKTGSVKYFSLLYLIFRNSTISLLNSCIPPQCC